MRSSPAWIIGLVLTLLLTPALVGQERGGGAKKAKGLGQGKTVKVMVENPAYQGMYYWVFIPKGVKKGSRYPLIMALHGNGDNSAGRIRSISRVSSAKLPAFVVAPQYQKGFKFNNPRYPDCPKIFREILAATCKAYPIDRARIVLQGFSMGSNYGSYLLWDWFKKDPGSCPFCAFWMSSTVDPNWLRGPRAPDIPYLLFVGDKEVAVKGVVNVIKQARDGYRYLFKQKMEAVYLQMPEMNHTVNRDCLELMREHLASLPSYWDLLQKDPRLPAVCDAAVDLCLAGKFGAGLGQLNALVGPKGTLPGPERAKIKAFVKLVESYAKKLAKGMGKLPKYGSMIAHYREVERLAGGVKGHKVLDKAFRSALEKLTKNKRLQKELSAYRTFVAAREKGGAAGEEKIKALAVGPLATTEYGKRSIAHIRALSDDYRN